jgi:hypothetical protein
MNRRSRRRSRNDIGRSGAASGTARTASNLYDHRPGSTSCPEWIIARDQGGESAHVKLAWLAGFLTAHNALFGLRHGPSNVLAGTDMDGAARWIDEHCTSHSGDNLAFGAQGLVTKLVYGQRARPR